MPWKTSAYEGGCSYCGQEFSYLEYHIRDRCEAAPVVAARIIAPEFFTKKKAVTEPRLELIRQVDDLIKRVRP